jgi:hypothetical protein
MELARSLSLGRSGSNVFDYYGGHMDVISKSAPLERIMNSLK